LRSGIPSPGRCRHDRPASRTAISYPRRTLSAPRRQPIHRGCPSPSPRPRRSHRCQGRLCRPGASPPPQRGRGPQLHQRGRLHREGNPRSSGRIRIPSRFSACRRLRRCGAPPLQPRGAALPLPRFDAPQTRPAPPRSIRNSGLSSRFFVGGSRGSLRLSRRLGGEWCPGEVASRLRS
jgi:hypothetical protein